MRDRNERPTLARMILAICAAWAVGVSGCGSDPASNAPVASGGEIELPAPEITLADAPDEPAAFLKWADRVLRKRVPAIQAPQNPRRAELRWPVVHLEESLSDAIVRSEWEPTLADEAPLYSAGPVASDKKPTQNWELIEATSRRGRKRVTFRAMGFSLLCDQIGRIAFRLQAPQGKFVELSWSAGGRLRLPLPGDDRVRTINVSTDDFAVWNGRINALKLQIDAVGDQPVRIEWLKFFGRADAFPEQADVARVSLGKELRTAIYAHTPAEIRFPSVRVPDNGKLQVGLGVLLPEASSPGDRPGLARNSRADTNPDTPPTLFEIDIEYAGERRTVLRESVVIDGKWVDVSASVAQWAGRDVSLTLRAENAGRRAVALWGNPLLYEPVEAPPCVIIYLIDTLSAKHINLYGYERETMPRLTAFAQKGAWFKNMLCNSPVTVSSVKDLLLAMPDTRHGVYSYSLQAPRQLIPLPEAVRHTGAATAMFSTNANAGPSQRTDRGFDHFFDRIAFAWTVGADRTVPIEAVINWITVHRDRPMFVYIHTAEPHAPYEPPQEFRGKLTKIQSAATDVRYDEEVLYADHRFGLFLDALEQIGLLDRAHFFVTADHGEELGEHGHYGHGKGMYQEVLGIPLVARGPRFTNHRRIDHPAQLMDLMPTILDFFEIPHPYRLTGVSLLPILEGRRSDDDLDRTVITSFLELRGQGMLEWVVNEDMRWKLMFVRAGQPTARPAKAKFELFDLHADPTETKNLIRKEPQIVRRLVGKLLAYMHENRPFLMERAQQNEGLEFDAKQIEDLRELGYVD